jgi:hypothetical protein
MMTPMSIKQKTETWNTIKGNTSFVHWAGCLFQEILAKDTALYPITKYKTDFLATWESYGLYTEYFSFIQLGCPYHNIGKLLRILGVYGTEPLGVLGETREPDVMWAGLDRLIGAINFSLLEEYRILADAIDMICEAVIPHTDEPVSNKKGVIILPMELEPYAPLINVEITIDSYLMALPSKVYELTPDNIKHPSELFVSPIDEIRIRTLYSLGREFIPVRFPSTYRTVKRDFPYLIEAF